MYFYDTQIYIMVKSLTALLSVALCAGMLLDSCKTDTIALSPQIITKVNVIATNNLTLVKDTFGFIDWDANGPNTPAQIDSLRLDTNSTYSVQVQLLNEAKTPVRDLSDTITRLGDEYLLAYTTDATDSLVSYQTLDRDSKGLPIGLRSNWRTYNIKRGMLYLKLHHQLGNKNGTETPGMIDFEAYYPIVVR